MIINGVETEMNKCIKNYVYLVGDRTRLLLVFYSVVEIIQSMNKSLGLMISCIRLGISQWEQQELNSGWDNDIHTPHPEKLQQEYGQMSPSTICQL